jgi:lipopolysaccharide transport system ATP-binding protein
MKTVIKAENIGKQYRLGEIGTGTISHDLNRWWAKLRGKEDPFSKVGAVNDRTLKADSDYVWALQDINFDVKQGEVLGIIGKNGAGKSTLLKILSKVTRPTTGRILTQGRIASLLEVGTGFHPEMTGRENIFLNGAIMGMTKVETKTKLDEIIDFAGVEKYIDTPVKRYSSGMYVRLAFAVAAHLNSEILIVDEVLAVGDAEFQKKCLGKMGDISKGEGRTVLFVSHNMGSIEMLCNKGLFLQNGNVSYAGDVVGVIKQYNLLNKSNEKFICRPNGLIFISEIIVKNEAHLSQSSFTTDDKLCFEIHLEKVSYVPQTIFLFFVQNKYGSRVFVIEKAIDEVFKKNNQSDRQIITISIASDFLMPGNYSCEVGVLSATSEYIDYHEHASPFEIVYGKSPLVKYGERNLGVVFPSYELKIDCKIAEQ